MARKSSEDIYAELSKPFPPLDIIWTVGEIVNGPAKDRAICKPSLSGKSVTERLNEVFGIGGWGDTYTILATKEAECRLSFVVDGEWVMRHGIGPHPRVLPGGVLSYDASYAIALCAAARRIGVGSYLDRLHKLSGRIHPESQKVIEAPSLPLWAIPDEWQVCGATYAGQMNGLIKTCAEKSAKSEAEVYTRLLTAHGYPASTSADLIPKIHANQMLQSLNAWIGDLAKKAAPARAQAQEKPKNAQAETAGK